MADHFPRALRAASPVTTSEVLARIAEHLATTRPTGVMTEAARMTLALRAAGTAASARPILRILPWPGRGITRGEYALHLRRAAWAAGYDARPASHTSGSDPDMDEALRRARRAPVRPAPGSRTFDDDSDDACGLCGNWTCTCGNPTGSTRVLAVAR